MTEKIQRPNEKYVTGEHVRCRRSKILIWYSGELIGASKNVSGVNKLMRKHLKGLNK
ncbi:hypothetical protein KAR91_18050 [Candidatus Pacearchaeota archaeon]|nr:hypothetical protein [Candidatus Pacearchaeota archaeon]